MFLHLKRAATIVAYLLMLASILALWNNDAPDFIYVGF